MKTFISSVLVLAVLTVSQTAKAGVRLDNGTSPCDGVGYTCDGCEDSRNGLYDEFWRDLGYMECCESIQIAALQQCLDNN